MKKLFTLCASAAIAFTLSAQADQPQGTMYVGITDATQLFNILDDEEDMNLTLTAGYAVSDGLVLMASIVQESYDVTDTLGVTESVDYDKATINLGVRYFRNGFYGQVNLNDFMDATGLDPDATISVGTLYNIEAMEGLYVDPSITLGRDESDDTEFSFNIGLGMRF